MNVTVPYQQRLYIITLIERIVKQNYAVFCKKNQNFLKKFNFGKIALFDKKIEKKCFSNILHLRKECDIIKNDKNSQEGYHRKIANPERIAIIQR